MNDTDMRIWGAYLIGYWHGIEAMKTAIPLGREEPYGLPSLLRELAEQERRA